MRVLLVRRSISAAFAVVVVLSPPLAVAAASANPHGSLDPGFGRGGIVTTMFGSMDAGAGDVAIDAKRRLVVAGGADAGFALARYNLDGSLDRSFGSGGKVVTPFPGGNASAVAIQPDGRLIAAGHMADSGPLGEVVAPRRFALARYHPDGSLDQSFGAGGKVVSRVGSRDAEINALVVEKDGQIVVAGYSIGRFHHVATLVRYRTNGKLDGSFGRDGTVTFRFGPGDSWAEGLGIQRGKLVVAGDTTSLFGVARFNPDGSFDRSFGAGGKATAAIGGDGGSSSALVVQKEDRLVVAGSRRYDRTTQDVFLLVRFNRDGSHDTGFGNGGRVTTMIGGVAGAFPTDLAIQADGKLVAVGIAGHVALARYEPNGSLDASFGTGGKVVAIDATAAAIAIQWDGKIVAAGVMTHRAQGVFFLARYLP